MDFMPLQGVKLRFAGSGQTKTTKQSAVYLPAFPEQPVENIRIYAQELQRNYGTYAEQYAGRPQSADGERYFNNIEIREAQGRCKSC